jgi:hypothetical protein
MGLDSGGQRLVALAIVLTFLTALAVVAAWILTSLSDAHIAALGDWLEANIGTIVTGALALAPAVATYLFGRRAGRKVGKTEAYASAIATAEGEASGPQVANTLRAEARNHNLKIVEP